MARLRVGDIEIDGTRVRIGGSRPGAHGALPAPVPQRTRAFFEHVPISSGGLFTAGFAAIAVGVIAVAFSSGPLDASTYITRGVFLIPFGFGLALLGGFKSWSARGLLAESCQSLDADTERSIRVLSALLVDADPSQTVEWIADRLAWSEADVVRTLAWMRERDEIGEELDTATGNFYYVSTPKPKDLDTRLRHLARGE